MFLLPLPLMNEHFQSPSKAQDMGLGMTLSS